VADSGTNPWRSRRVVGFAHQGGALEGEPGTIETMRLARRNGASALEFDVHRSSDGALVVHHDPVVPSAGGVSLRIRASTLGDLRRVKPELATMDEVLAAFPGVPLTVEVKARDAAVPAARALAAEHPRRRAIVTAFSPFTVSAVRKAEPSLDTAPGWPTVFGFWLVSRLFGLPLPRVLCRRHVALQAALHLGQVAFVRKVPLLRRLRITDARLVHAAHARDLAVHVWTLDDERTIGAALDAGADGVFTDRPSVLTSVLDARGARWRDGAEGG
jgi:glycerophosphoryl diester phosphodiesterase